MGEVVKNRWCKRGDQSESKEFFLSSFLGTCCAESIELHGENRDSQIDENERAFF